MSTISIFVLAVLAAILSLAEASCGNFCKFRFCAADGFATIRPKCPRLLIRAPGTSLSAYVCHPRIPNLGVIRTIGEAIADGRPISQWSPPGLTRKFSKTFFGLFKLNFLGGLQGMGRRKAKGNQKDFLDDICVILPIRSWDILKPDGSILRTISRSKPGDCVAYETRYPMVLVELQWDSSDDLDLELVEPDGDLVNRGNPESEAGRLNNDNNVGACGIVPAGKEAIIYDSRKRALIESGKYTVTVRHFNNCGNGRTQWMLRVMVHDIVILVRKGRSNLDSGSVIGTEMFTVNIRYGLE